MGQINPTLPTAGASEGVWGSILNTALGIVVGAVNALDTAIGGLVSKPLARTVFSSRANGSWTAQDSGQAVGNTGSAPLTIASGVLTHTNSQAGTAGYAESSLGQRVGRLSVSFTIPDVTKSGTVTMVAPAASWVSGGVGSSAAACHFYCTATDWAYQVVDGGSLVTLAQGTHVLLSNVEYHLDITFDGTTAMVVLPSGRVVSVTDSRISTNMSTWALWELYNPLASSVPAKISSVRADGVTTAPFGATTASRIGAAAGSADATTTSKGVVQLAGDLAGTATSPTVPGLAAKAPLNSPAFTGTPTGITKAHVGLGNVDNTADTAKPVSTAQQTALNAKAPLASPALTGTPTAPTATAGTISTQLATTEFVAGKAAKFYRSTTLGSSANTQLVVPLTSTFLNDDTNYYALSSGDVQVKLAGLYVIHFWAAIDNPSAGSVYGIFVQQSGTTVSESSAYTNTGTMRLTGSFTARLAANDLLRLMASSNGSPTFTVSGSGAAKDVGISVARIGA